MLPTRLVGSSKAATRMDTGRLADRKTNHRNMSQGLEGQAQEQQ